MKNNLELVEFVKNCMGLPYIYGTFGQVLTASLIEAKAKQYPRQLTQNRKNLALKNYIGKRSVDCIGLIKYFLWSDPSGNPKYDKNTDWSADDTYCRAGNKGTIKTMPDVPGVCVRYAGHVGVYIGDGEVIEARGFDYGVVMTNLADRKWTHWYYHPLISYTDVPVSKPQLTTPKATTTTEYVVVKGDTLTKIAKKFNTTVSAIVALNGLNNPNLIVVGQKLKITLENPTTQNNPISAPNTGTNTGTNTATPQKTLYAIVNTNHSALNMRTKASMTGDIICAIPKGTKIELVAMTNNDWYQVRYKGKTGYCSTKYLKVGSV